MGGQKISLSLPKEYWLIVRDLNSSDRSELFRQVLISVCIKIVTKCETYFKICLAA